ncbi:serine-rich adhesin for platelets isoform X2 [Toxorhynchites rutilus septentrionalis]|uniref:serine-rich adhesin for platelets isoform X2 n=1 Tax=Toxorhynchites rutilus septentrionalis TaxID=329112 RepID=UPI0024792398|nr:serine-rich adhesin for platelets isoform X2 [Toxorhynchites rutilus septentrionalis]
MSDLCTLGSRPGMECVPLRSPADPYHYHHVTDQTKSLQELQNEVGALLEFRDLVIETFPDLKTKMASSAANSTLTGIPSSSLASRREWEPGIRTRRKLTQKETSAEIHQHSSSLTRSRSNSHSGKKEPKSGEGNNGSVIQDSGFSTETSSSKETHSASSTGGGVQGTVVSNTTNRLTVDTEDELWNLLDVIHRKSNRLREEVDALQQLEREKCRTSHTNVVVVSSSSSSSNSNNNNNNNNTNLNAHHHSGSSSSSSSSSSGSNNSGNLPHAHQPPVPPSANQSATSVGVGVGLAKTFQNQLLVDIVNKDDVQILRKERDRLFDKLSEYEAEAIAGRIRSSKMQDEVDALALAKRELEDQLKAALSQKLELNSKIHDLHQQFVNKSAPSSPDSLKNRRPLATSSTIMASSSPPSQQQQHVLKPRFTQSSFAPVKSVSSTKLPAPVAPSAVVASMASRTASAAAVDDDLLDTTSPTITTASSTSIDEPNTATRLNHTGVEIVGLGKLDGLISSPARLSKVRMTDSKKIAAILLETNIVELQRHLLTITVQNQVLQQRLDHATRSRIFLSKKLDKSKEDIDDLKFRLEEKNIELEGTKAQLRVLESKQSGGGKSGFSPEHGANSAKTSPTVAAGATVVTTSAGGIVSHQHRSVSTSELSQLSPVHHHHHYQQQQQHHPQQQRDLALRLQQTQVSTPSMKAMVPLAMDEVLQHSSSTESAQDQAERDSGSHNKMQCPETPRRRPSKIPLPGTKGYVAPKPPTGRNFTGSQHYSRQDKSSPSPSGSLSNKSLNKSTGSLYMKSTGPSSITSASRDKKDTSLNRPDSAQSWRRDSSLDKSRSSSIPVSKGSSGGGSPVAKQSVVNISPQPKAKRDSLTTRVKNFDSLSRFQTASVSTTNLSKSSSKKDLSSSFTTGQLRDRKQSGNAIRRVSSASVGGRGSSAEQNNNNNGSSPAASSDGSPAANSNSSSDNGKARRANTFRLAKPTVMPPLEIITQNIATATVASSAEQRRRRNASAIPTIAGRGSTTAAAARSSALIITTSSPAAYPSSSTSTPLSSPSSSSSAPSSQSSVTTVTTIESHSSVGQTVASRDLIGEYLAAKSRSQQAPAMFGSKVTPARDQHDDRQQQQLALAYKHPILLMNEDENSVFCSVASSVGNEKNREMEEKLIADNSIELLDAEGEKESLIVPKPKKTMAFHSPARSSPVRLEAEEERKCRLVGKVNPNILKTWEQLSSGGNNEGNYCEHKRKDSKNSLITVTSSENSGGDKQSCLIFYRNQYNMEEKASDFMVTRIRHSSLSTSSNTAADDDEEEERTTTATATTATISVVTSTATTETSSEGGCYDFYDSIDDSSSSRMLEHDGEEDDEYVLAAGEGMADFTSLDKSRLMWSIDVE